MNDMLNIETPFQLTKHAMARMQQRGISRCDVEFLCKFGSTKYLYGAKAKVFDKRSMKKLRKYIGN